MRLAILACLIALVFETSVIADSPVREFRESLAGEWEISSTQMVGESARNATEIRTLLIRDELIVIEDANGGKRQLDFQVLQSENGWVIDLYRRGGKADGRLYPSLISLRDNELRILLPINSAASHHRPSSFDTSANQNWILLRLDRTKSSL